MPVDVKQENFCSFMQIFLWTNTCLDDKIMFSHFHVMKKTPKLTNKSLLRAKPVTLFHFSIFRHSMPGKRFSILILTCTVRTVRLSFIKQKPSTSPKISKPFWKMSKSKIPTVHEHQNIFETRLKIIQSQCGREGS